MVMFLSFLLTNCIDFGNIGYVLVVRTSILMEKKYFELKKQFLFFEKSLQFLFWSFMGVYLLF